VRRAKLAVAGTVAQPARFALGRPLKGDTDMGSEVASAIAVSIAAHREGGVV
jgi:hypothetical protein